jgi:hypothetical protein
MVMISRQSQARFSAAEALASGLGDKSRVPRDVSPIAGDASPQTGDTSPIAGDAAADKYTKSPASGGVSTSLCDVSPMFRDVSLAAGVSSLGARDLSASAGDMSGSVETGAIFENYRAFSVETWPKTAQRSAGKAERPYESTEILSHS